MCGIIGCAGEPDARDFLLSGLRLLEYRGYDSAGLALSTGDGLAVAKCAGRVADLERRAADLPREALAGIAHTRWATHGGVTEANAHPHLDASGRFAVVHNGIVENYRTLRAALESEGVRFKSETDSEVIAHLIAKLYQGDLAEAVRLTARELRGTYGLAAMCADEPGVLVAARMGSPLVAGLAGGGVVVASDVPALVARASRAVYLNDGEVLRAGPGGYSISTLDRAPITPEIAELDHKLESIELGPFEHYMLKEIHDQPAAIVNTLAGRVQPGGEDVVLGGARISPEEARRLRRVVAVGCGTSWHAGLIGKYVIEDLLRLPVETEYASELRYRNPIVRPEEDLAVFISQSGETADTLAALRELKRKGARTLGICNVVNSTIAREVHSGVYTHAGPEIGVASTKAFTTQVTALVLLALHIGRHRDLAGHTVRDVASSLWEIPSLIGRMLEPERVEAVRRIAREVVERGTRNFLYLGRGVNFPVALEGALKMKEISYIHAEGYPAAEMKHGPIALIDEDMPVVVIAPRDRTREKVKSNIEELLARKARIAIIATEGDEEMAELAGGRVVYVPPVIEPVLPLLTVVPLQLLAYHTALLKGLAVDKPRNLAKSVTVE